MGFSLSVLTDSVPSLSALRIPASTICIMSSTAPSPSAHDARSSTHWRSLASTPRLGGSQKTRWAQQQQADRKPPAREFRWQGAQQGAHVATRRCCFERVQTNCRYARETHCWRMKCTVWWNERSCFRDASEQLFPPHLQQFITFTLKQMFLNYSTED